MNVIASLAGNHSGNQECVWASEATLSFLKLLPTIFSSAVEPQYVSAM